MDISEEHPGKTVTLWIGEFPRIAFDRGEIEVTTGSDAPLTPETMAEIINSLITDEEGAYLKRKHYVRSQVADELYLRDILINYYPNQLRVTIASKLLRDVEIENRKIEDAASTLGLIKG